MALIWPASLGLHGQPKAMASLYGDDYTSALQTSRAWIESSDGVPASAWGLYSSTFSVCRSFLVFHTHTHTWSC